MDTDELASARKLLEKGLEPGGLGPHAVEEIPMTVPEGLSVLAFGIPSMAQKWVPRIREIAMDSACEWPYPIRTLY